MTTFEFVAASRPPIHNQKEKIMGNYSGEWVLENNTGEEISHVLLAHNNTGSNAHMSWNYYDSIASGATVAAVAFESGSGGNDYWTCAYASSIAGIFKIVKTSRKKCNFTSADNKAKGHVHLELNSDNWTMTMPKSGSCTASYDQ